jgi:CDP-2,3-bis-(O-geranylgeranyl)-sn-glycerol synthase
MFYDILFAFWFFIPAGIANTSPILAAKLPLLKEWNAPMDFSMSRNGKRLLGAHKTWRGIISGIVVGMLVFWIQQHISFDNSDFHDYLVRMGYFEPTAILGGLLGLGALLGDAAESFVKRLYNIHEGHTWFPYDQLDYIIGGCLFSALALRLPWEVYAWIFVVWFVMHLLFSYIGYKLGFKEAPI